jgi:hypothetical protein
VSDAEAEHAKELRELQEKLNAERNSAVHLRIAAVEAQARSDRDTQALVNKSLGDRIDGVKGAVDEVKAAQDKGFSDVRIGLILLGIGLALTLMANLPGLLSVLKGKVP